jgi:pimeloyl-ACP methyl ester carboxylesterase
MWLAHAVYPVNFVWESGGGETLGNHVADLLRGRMPAAGLGDMLVEQFDRMVENTARKSIRWMWREMKENARAASAPAGPRARPQPGATRFVQAFASYVQQHPEVRVHLVGHSAGSIFHGALLERLESAGIRVETLSLLAPAIRVDEFEQQILPRLGRQVQRFACFVLSDRLELDDTCGAGPITPYRKSLLYLVSRALEPPVDDSLPHHAHRSKPHVFEVPVLGMERFLTDAVRSNIAARNGEIIVSPCAGAPGYRTKARTHGGFDDDDDTMRSVLVRIVGDESVAAPAEAEPSHEGGPPPAGGAPRRRVSDYQGIVVLRTDATEETEEEESPLVEHMVRGGLWQEVPPPQA